MKYKLEYKKQLKKIFIKLDNVVFERIKTTLEKLSTNPFPQGCKKLKGRDGFRVRVGDYRILYKVEENDKIIYVLDIGHRSDIYD